MSSSPITRGWQLTKQSLAVLSTHKKLLIFPLISTIATILLLSFFVTPITHLVIHEPSLNHLSPHRELLLLGLVLIILFLCNAIMIFCNSALIFATVRYFKNEPVSFSSAFKAACQCFPRGIVWILFNTTIGAILRFFQNRLNSLGILASSLAGMTWTVVSYFVVPVLVIENAGPFQSIKRSITLLRETWGSSLVSNLGVSLLLFAARLIAFTPAILGFYFGHTTDLILGFAVSMILLYVIHLFNSAIRNVLRVALYQYATNETLSPYFDADSLKSAFRSRSSKNSGKTQ